MLGNVNVTKKKKVIHLCELLYHEVNSSMQGKGGRYILELWKFEGGWIGSREFKQ